MINIALKEVHVGQAISKRLEEMKITKTEFGRRIGVPQQHINRLLERDTMETKRLIKVCQALEYNFFALFCEFPTSVNAYLAAVALGDGDANNNIGDTSLLAQTEVYKERGTGLTENNANLKDQIGTLKDQISTLKETIVMLKSQLQDKEEIIKMMKSKK